MKENENTPTSPYPHLIDKTGTVQPLLTGTKVGMPLNKTINQPTTNWVKNNTSQARTHEFSRLNDVTPQYLLGSVISNFRFGETLMMTNVGS